MLGGDPGALLEAINYEISPSGGYRTTSGYQKTFQFPGYVAAANNLQQLGYHPALAAGYVAAGNDENGPSLMWTLYDAVGEETVVWRQALGILPVRIEFTDTFSGVFVHDGVAKTWLFFVSRGGRIDAITAAAPDGNPFLTEITDVTTFIALRPMDTVTKDIDSYGTVHANHAWVSSGPSLFCSALGDPTDWTTALSGAAEFRMDHEIIGLTSTTGGVLLIYTSRGVFGLYGTDTETWQIKRVASDIRVLPRSIQDAGVPVFAAEGMGLVTLPTAQEFGDFSANTMGPDITAVMRGIQRVVVSYVDPSESQYRIVFLDYFSRKRHACVPILAGQPLGVTYLDWPDEIIAFARLRLSGDENVSVFPLYGADASGNVYEIGGLDSGSFNEEPIRSFLATRFTHCGSPGVRKRFRRVHIELDTFRWQIPSSLIVPVAITGLPLFDEGDPDLPGHAGVRDLRTVGALRAGFWDVDAWDEFFWAGQSFQFATMSVTGTGETFALALSSERQNGPGHTVMGFIVEYDERRKVRG